MLFHYYTFNTFIFVFWSPGRWAIYSFHCISIHLQRIGQVVHTFHLVPLSVSFLIAPTSPVFSYSPALVLNICCILCLNIIAWFQSLYTLWTYHLDLNRQITKLILANPSSFHSISKAKTFSCQNYLPVIYSFD